MSKDEFRDAYERAKLDYEERVEHDIIGMVGLYDVECFEILVKRNEPMKANIKTYNKYDIIFLCSKCNSIVKRFDYYCSSCGQALDWTDK